MEILLVCLVAVVAGGTFAVVREVGKLRSDLLIVYKEIRPWLERLPRADR